jgi:anti-sigma regulatory factor (Ser/Thr protein kinase)
MSELSEVLAYAQLACGASPLERDTLLRIQLALEELFTNTVQHGYGGDCESPVWVHASLTTAHVCVTYEDAAPPYDPLGHEIDIDASCAERHPGGLGVLLARSIADQMAYRRVENRNVITLTFQTVRTSAAS